MFTYWGRRGALAHFALEATRAALADPRLVPTLSVSCQNENFGAFAEMGPALFPIDTFSNSTGALTQAWRISPLRRRLHEKVRQDKVEAVIEADATVWSPLIMPTVRDAGATYCTIVHDADAHPGDNQLGQAAARSIHAISRLSGNPQRRRSLRIVAKGHASPPKVRPLLFIRTWGMRANANVTSRPPVIR